MQLSKWIKVSFGFPSKHQSSECLDQPFNIWKQKYTLQHRSETSEGVRYTATILESWYYGMKVFVSLDYPISVVLQL